jgi:hypothetical protein
LGERILPDLVSLACSLKPSPEQLLTVPVERGRVPMHAPKLIDAVEKLEALLVWWGYPVECFVEM